MRIKCPICHQSFEQTQPTPEPQQPDADILSILPILGMTVSPEVVWNNDLSAPDAPDSFDGFDGSGDFSGGGAGGSW